ncbi:hypothetical protein [Deinococcus cellulosilyticus]|uniref:Uncharacterized protein n=1 Tax=Deinococcus cellulosilyticus (strain DSM 18568 / NBRC 106333 / KACC 11606 / 5516J-15) TaxID=1223518 RepID=A0A511N6A9_DEIC1|nr:hypothetical protein [Deinococcus cellulosilyticus]GEM48409.1 hypothetical protein DC3_40440 [Deinococcus cellulosilyticus NBRC 106333 = KACC 11606]
MGVDFSHRSRQVNAHSQFGEGSHREIQRVTLQDASSRHFCLKPTLERHLLAAAGNQIRT